MVKVSPVEQLFTAFDETATLLEEELSCTYLEALAEAGEDFFHYTVLQDEVSEVTKKRIQKKIEEVNVDRFSSEQIRKAFQLCILKGMKKHTQPHHQMTPDSIGLIVSYLIGKFMNTSLSFSLLDPAIGTGNLVYTILNGMPEKQIQTYGVDVDDVLLKLAYTNANLQKHSIQLYNQDSIAPLLVPKVDAVVCDLPVGYYPDDIRAQEYRLKAKEGHSYAHHLLLEQSINYTKDGGYLFFVIPNHLFESDQSKQLHEYIKEVANIQAVLQLPLSMFKNEKLAKSIFILQKKKDGVKPPKQVLLAQLPKLSDGQAMERFLWKVDNWFEENN